MAILTIEELKTLWANGFVPEEQDYMDLFDSIQALGSNNEAVKFLRGTTNPNGSQGEESDTPPAAEITQFITNNPDSLLFYIENREIPRISQEETEEGILRQDNLTWFWVKNPTGTDPSEGFWQRIVSPYPFPEFNSFINAVGIENYNPTTRTVTLFSQNQMEDLGAAEWEQNEQLTIKLADGGNVPNPITPRLPMRTYYFINKGEGSIVFEPANVGADIILTPENKLPRLSTKGVIVLRNIYDGQLGTTQWVFSGDLDSNAPSGATIQRVKSDFTAFSLTDQPIELIPAQGVDKVIFIDKIFISYLNQGGFKTETLLSEFKVGNNIMASAAIFFEFGGDQRQHFIVQSAQDQVTRSFNVSNLPLTWTINPQNLAGFASDFVDFSVVVYYTVEDIIDGSNAPS